MTDAIYTLPDHEVVKALVPHITDRHLSDDAARDRIRAVPGLIPLAVDPTAPGRVLWGDLGAHPFREWQFVYTIRKLAEAGAIGEAFTTDVTILDDASPFADSIRPDGLIFHVSRCGSTLVAKALARADGVIMVSQGGPLQQGFWALITDDWRREAVPDAQTLRRLRTLILAMTRRRCENERHAFIKFISWNVLYIDLIAAAFPGVPCLFLYRDPVEVIASVRKKTTAVLRARGTPQGAFLTGLTPEVTATMDETSYLASCYARYFETVYAAGTDVACVDYRDITADSFASILDDGLGFLPEEGELGAMLEQFRYHSKDDSDAHAFHGDHHEKQSALTSHERRLIDALCSGPLKRLASSERRLRVGHRRQQTINQTVASARPHP